MKVNKKVKYVICFFLSLMMIFHGIALAYPVGDLHLHSSWSADSYPKNL
jgi:hypothetical protein